MNTANTELVQKSDAPDIDTMKRADVPAIWDGYRSQLEKLKATAETLTVTDVSQKAEMKLARATRLTLKDLRVEIEHRRKELGEEALRRKQTIDSQAKELRDLIEPLETRLLEQEQFAERRAAEELAEEVRQRTATLMPFWNALLPLPDIGALTDRQFEILFEETKATHEAKLAAAKKAEDVRLAKELADTQERQRIEADNERLRKEAAERDAAAKKEREAAEAKAREEKAKADAEIARVKAEADAKAKAEMIKAGEAAREADEKARKEREAAEAVARKERLAREKAEADLRAKEQVEEKARKDAEAAARKAARAPDKIKLAAFRKALCELKTPMMATHEGKQVVVELNQQINDLAEWIETKESEL